MRDQTTLQQRRERIQQRFNTLMNASRDPKLREHLERIRKDSGSETPVEDLLADTTRILLVDDLAYITHTVSYMLAKENYNVHVAKNGAEGIMLFMNTLPDIVITDLRLPDFNGMILSRLIRKLDEQVPIIFITANDLDPEIGLEWDLDVKHYDLDKANMTLLLKPIQKEVILSTIRRLLGEGTTAAS